MKRAYWLDQVAFAYGDRPALAIDHLAIHAGKVSALIGPNGSGKSTLLNLFAFLICPDAGEMYFFGQPVRGEDTLALRRRVGLVTQNPYLLRGSVMDNVELGLKLRGFECGQRRRHAGDALDRVGLAGFAARPVNALSGGEKQRVALARALAPEPDVLLFDEPFTYLDQGGVHLVEQAISDYARKSGKTVVFSTHERLQGAALADESISLFAGRTVGAPLVNLFRGTLRDGVFDTGKLAIQVARMSGEGSYLAVDPEEIVLSSNPLNSSLRNSFPGRIIMIAEEAGRARVTVDIGEKLHARITLESLRSLALGLGKNVWVSFKATAVKVF